MIHWDAYHLEISDQVTLRLDIVMALLRYFHK